MSTLVEELSQRARALSNEDRALLAEHLLETLPDDSEADTEAAWGLEIATRLEDAKLGTARWVSSEDVHAQARRIYR